MKTIYKQFIGFITIAILSVIYSSCEDEITQPTACFEVPELTYVGDATAFKICGSGDRISIWPGDSLHNYDLREDTTIKDETGILLRNMGIDVGNAETYSYAYEQVGEFVVTLVATNVGGELGKQLERDVTQKTITVTDDQDVFSSFALGFQIRQAFVSIYPSRSITRNSVLIPIDSTYDVSDMAAKFEAGFADVFVNGEKQVSTKNKHDFTEPITYTIKPYDGSAPNEVVVKTFYN
jgi:hypothetical protein